MGDADASELPLSGLTVVELGTIVAAPFAGVVLADLGADVTKVERPDGGDVMRDAGDSGDAIFFSLNRNKRSLTLDLKQEEGRAAYRRLVADADVVVENLGPGVADRLGVGYEAIREDNPGLVYLSIKGFQEGPYGDRAGIDMVGEAMSGLMSTTGEPGRRPLRVGTSIADMGAAMYGLMGVFLSLWRRERTGEGGKVTGSLFESATHWMSYWMVYAQLTGEDPPPLGSTHSVFGLYDVFETDGGWLFVGVATSRHWPAFCRAAGTEHLLSDERFDTTEKRSAHKEELTQLVREELRTHDRAELLAALLDEGVPAAPVNRPSDLVEDPHLRDTGLLTDFAAEYGGERRELQAVLAPLGGTGIDAANRADPPELGEDSRSVLAELGYSEREVDALFDAGVSGVTPE